MSLTHLFPSFMILASSGAAIVYGCGGNLRQTVYWTCAAIMTAAVTF